MLKLKKLEEFKKYMKKCFFELNECEKSAGILPHNNKKAPKSVKTTANPW